MDASALQRDPFGATVEVHEELGSTNDRAAELIAAGSPLPAIVVARRQTAGRGRGAHRWWSSDGALTFSLALDAADRRLEPDRYRLVALATGLAVLDAVRQTSGLAAGLKWPNDVLLEGKKLAGVLIEAPRPGRLVIGVGVNVANRFDGAPDEVRARAATLSDFASLSRQQVLTACLDALNNRLIQVGAGDPALIQAARASCVLTGKYVTLCDGQRVTTGECCGIDDEGALRLRTDQGVTSHYAGTIEHIAENA